MIRLGKWIFRSQFCRSTPPTLGRIGLVAALQLLLRHRSSRCVLSRLITVTAARPPLHLHLAPSAIVAWTLLYCPSSTLWRASCRSPALRLLFCLDCYADVPLTLPGFLALYQLPQSHKHSFSSFSCPSLSLCLRSYLCHRVVIGPRGISFLLRGRSCPLFCSTRGLPSSHCPFRRPAVALSVDYDL